ncbi:MAG: GNAT family N-acetyltransferase [Cyanobacteria bacterium J06626_6]
MNYRPATELDVDAIAKLHALSWQNAYRGMLSDWYLSQEVYPERLNVWETRLKQSKPHQFVVVAEDEQEIVGFACAFGSTEKRWGALLDNLHIHPAARRKGIGKALMQQVAMWIIDNYDSHQMHLFVFAANKGACLFYERLGGKENETKEMAMPDGELVPSIKYVWERVDSMMVDPRIK